MCFCTISLDAIKSTLQDSSSPDLDLAFIINGFHHKKMVLNNFYGDRNIVLPKNWNP